MRIRDQRSSGAPRGNLDFVVGLKTRLGLLKYSRADVVKNGLLNGRHPFAGIWKISLSFIDDIFQFQLTPAHAT